MKQQRTNAGKDVGWGGVGTGRVTLEVSVESPKGANVKSQLHPSSASAKGLDLRPTDTCSAQLAAALSPTAS